MSFEEALHLLKNKTRTHLVRRRLTNQALMIEAILQDIHARLEL